MTKKRKRNMGAILMAVLLTSPILVAQEHDAKVKQDLFAVITLQGQSCGRVTSYQRLGENDYIATCQTGDRYHVNVVSGRVQVKRQ